MHIRGANLEDVSQLVKLGKNLLTLHTDYNFDYYRLEERFDELFGNWVKDQLNHPYQFMSSLKNIPRDFR